MNKGDQTGTVHAANKLESFLQNNNPTTVYSPKANKRYWWIALGCFLWSHVLLGQYCKEKTHEICECLVNASSLAFVEEEYDQAVLHLKQAKILLLEEPYCRDEFDLELARQYEDAQKHSRLNIEKQLLPLFNYNHGLTVMMKDRSYGLMDSTGVTKVEPLYAGVWFSQAHHLFCASEERFQFIVEPNGVVHDLVTDVFSFGAEDQAANFSSCPNAKVALQQLLDQSSMRILLLSRPTKMLYWKRQGIRPPPPVPVTEAVEESRTAELFTRLRQLPPEFCNLQDLLYIDLSYHHLQTLPQNIGTLTQLQQLHLEGNAFRRLPVVIGTLSSLQILKIGFNNLTKLPDEWSQMKQLKELDLAYNKLRQVPSCIQGMSQLQVLSLKGNRIKTLPKWLKDLPALRILNLHKCPIPSRERAYWEQQLSQCRIYW